MEKQVDKSLSTLKGFGLRSVFDFFSQRRGQSCAALAEKAGFQAGIVADSIWPIELLLMNHSE